MFFNDLHGELSLSNLASLSLNLLVFCLLKIFGFWAFPAVFLFVVISMLSLGFYLLCDEQCLPKHTLVAGFTFCCYFTCFSELFFNGLDRRFAFDELNAILPIFLIEIFANTKLPICVG